MNIEIVALAADSTGHTSTAEAVTFWVLGTVAVLSAIAMVAARKAVYSAINLATVMISLAVLYIAQDALFLGIVQVVVYTGAVMMLFLFVVMLIGVDSSESLVETIRGQRIAAVVVGVGFGVLLIAGIGNLSVAGFAGLPDANNSGNVEGLAALIFTRYLWAFELTSALLITAALGAMVLRAPGAFRTRQDSAGDGRRALQSRRPPDPATEPRCVRQTQCGRHPGAASRRLRYPAVSERNPAATKRPSACRRQREW